MAETTQTKQQHKNKDTRQQDTRGQESEFDQQVLDIARVARVTAGGRRFSFRATVVVGDRRGRVGVGTGKGGDVSIAVNKAVRIAKKNIIQAPITQEGTIPHQVIGKQTGSVVFLKPARVGRGIIAGGATRVICDFAGYENITGKILSRSGNKLNVALATINALNNVKFNPNPKKMEKENSEQVQTEDKKKKTSVEDKKEAVKNKVKNSVVRKKAKEDKKEEK